MSLQIHFRYTLYTVYSKCDSGARGLFASQRSVSVSPWITSCGRVFPFLSILPWGETRATLPQCFRARFRTSLMVENLNILQVIHSEPFWWNEIGDRDLGEDRTLCVVGMERRFWYGNDYYILLLNRLKRQLPKMNVMYILIGDGSMAMSRVSPVSLACVLMHNPGAEAKKCTSFLCGRCCAMLATGFCDSLSASFPIRSSRNLAALRFTKETALHMSKNG